MIEIEYEGITYQIGNNAQDNWDMLDNAEKNWIWFHLDNLTSPYVILKESIKSIKEDKYNFNYKNYIYKGGSLCKEYSKFKSQKVSFIFTEVKNVRKGTKIGEALIKGKVKKYKI